LAASQGYQEAYDLKERGHSIFTFFLLEGLKGHKEAVNNDGYVTPETIGKFIHRKIVSLPSDRRPKQTPLSKGEASGEIVLTEYPHLRKKEQKNDGSLVSEGIQYFENGDNETALKLFDQAIEINPKNVRAHNYKGDVFFRLQKYEEAIKWYDCFEKALEINPKVLESWYHKGLILKRVERFNDAINCFDKVLDLRPDDIEVLIDKGIVLEILKKYDKAIECYNKAISIDPFDVDAKNRIDILSSISYSSNVKSKKTEYYKAVAVWGSKGSEDGQFESPRGMAVNHRGTVYVVDSGNHRIQKFDSSGNFVTKWGSNWDSNLNKTYGIDLRTRIGNLGMRTLSKYSNGKFCFPHGIAMDIDNVNIYVVDRSNHRIQKFDSNGKFVTKWSYISTENNNKSFCPELISVDNNGNVYTYDSSSNQIVKFSLQQ
jgi:Flp pilus assembly protein TadD